MRGFVQKREAIDKILIILSEVVVPLEHTVNRVHTHVLKFCVVPKRRWVRRHAVVRALRAATGHVVHVDYHSRPSLLVQDSKNVRQRHLIDSHLRSIAILWVFDHSRRAFLRAHERRPIHR